LAPASCIFNFGFPKSIPTGSELVQPPGLYSCSMKRWFRSLIPGAIQFGFLWLILGCFPALQAVLLAMTDLALLGLGITVVAGIIYFTVFKEVRAFWPALLATFVRVGDMLWPIVTAGVIAGYFFVPGIQHAKIDFPAWSSSAARVGASLGAFMCVLYFSELTSSLGFPPGLKLAPRFRVAIRFKYFALVIATGTVFPAAAKPQWVAIPVSISAAVYLALSAHFTMRLARQTYKDFPVAEGSTPQPLAAETPLALHITDVHLVAQGATRIEGGSGGNQRLAGLVGIIITRSPEVLLITGDLTDHGLPIEYQEAAEILKPILKSAPAVKVLLAPGNHDLGTAYSATDQLLALGSAGFQGSGPSGTNGLLMMRYLEEAVRFHPPILDCTGQPLADRLERAKERDARFEEVLERTRRHLRLQPFDTAALSELVAAGEELYPGSPPKAGWPQLLKHPGIFREMYLRSLYVDELWYEPFPLRATLEDGSEVLILNSVSPDPTMSGSAWGELGDPQLARLRQMLTEGIVQRHLILVHHAPLRWSDEPMPRRVWADLQRWAFLAFGIEDLLSLLDTLKAAAADGHDIVVFCGHRHGHKKDYSDPADIGVCRSGTYQGITVVEGASLADKGTGVVAVITEHQSWALRTVNL
jgi:3',5'-cyclic AMP phosphodiesterase CpdA